jgi:acyl-coenzyme A thioesterase PaaI-like protein
MPFQQLIDRSIAFVQRSGLRVLDCGPGYAQCWMPLAGNENHVGTMYAGAQFTLADITGGVLILASFDRRLYYPILKNLQLDFLTPATGDLILNYCLSPTTLTDLQRALQVEGKAGFELKGELTDSDSVVVARSHGVFQVRVVKE